MVQVPVLRGANLRYVLRALVKPDAIRNALVRQQVPSDWVISIVDATGQRVARSRAHDENLGGRLSETAARIVDGGGAEGFGISTSLEGEQIFAPYSRLVSSGWVAVLGLPTAAVVAATYRSLAIYGGGIVLSIAFSTLVASWVARTIVTPIAELRAAAEALSHGETPGHRTLPSVRFARSARACRRPLKISHEAKRHAKHSCVRSACCVRPPRVRIARRISSWRSSRTSCARR